MTAKKKPASGRADAGTAHTSKEQQRDQSIPAAGAGQLGSSDEMAERIRLNVPDQLRSLRAWVCWRKKREPGKAKVGKVPVYATSGENRSGTQGTLEDRALLVTLDEALAAMKRHKLDGVGIAMLEGNNLVGIDGDSAKDENGEWKPLARELLDAHTYAETSPSGNGFRMFFRGQMPNVKNHNAGGGVGIELFSTSGFLTVTGQRLNGNDIATLDEPMRQRLGELTQAKNIGSEWAVGDKKLGPGERNVFLTKVAGKLRYSGLNETIILASLLAVNANCCDPPLEKNDVATIAHSVGNYALHHWDAPVNIFAKLAAPLLTAARCATGTRTLRDLAGQSRWIRR